jgi:hypothetical protein
MFSSIEILLSWFQHVPNCLSPYGGETSFTLNVSRRALSGLTNTFSRCSRFPHPAESRVVLLSVPFGSGLLAFMVDKAVDSITSASDHTSSQPTPWSGGPAMVRHSSLPSLPFVAADSTVCCITACLSVGFDLGFPGPPLLHAGPCERWAQSHCFGKELNERTI